MKRLFRPKTGFLAVQRTAVGAKVKYISAFNGHAYAHKRVRKRPNMQDAILHVWWRALRGGSQAADTAPCKTAPSKRIGGTPIEATNTQKTRAQNRATAVPKQNRPGKSPIDRCLEEGLGRRFARWFGQGLRQGMGQVPSRWFGRGLDLNRQPGIQGLGAIEIQQCFRKGFQLIQRQVSHR